MQDIETETLRFAEAHELITANQATELLVGRCPRPLGLLETLEADALLTPIDWLASAERGYSITAAGLTCLDSAMGPPSLELRDLRRTLASGWVWLRARDGRFDVVDVLSRRQLLAEDQGLVSDRTSDRSRAQPYGLRVPGHTSASDSGLQYPDVLVMLHDGWAAVHVQFESVDRGRLAALLRAYGADERFGVVVFVVEEERVAVEIEAVAASVGVARMTSVQWMQWG